MSKIISVVPNICEAKNTELITSISEKLRAVPGLVLLDVSRDTFRNRTVFSFTGTVEAIYEGGFLLYDEALKNIDMREHKGEYPRIGAVDVFPFVPLKDMRMEEAIEIATTFAEEVAERFSVPVYLFGESARFPSRRSVENIRHGEYEGFTEKMRSNRWKPDFGPDEFKPTFGATMIGARYPLISFEVFVRSHDEEPIFTVADTLNRLRYVRANAAYDQEREMMELTVTITNYRKMAMYTVLELIKSELRRYGLVINRTDMIGIIPERALIESALYYLNIQQFPMERLLERSIQKHLDEQLVMEEYEEQD